VAITYGPPPLGRNHQPPDDARAGTFPPRSTSDTFSRLLSDPTGAYYCLCVDLRLKGMVGGRLIHLQSSSMYTWIQQSW